MHQEGHRGVRSNCAVSLVAFQTPPRANSILLRLLRVPYRLSSPFPLLTPTLRWWAGCCVLHWWLGAVRVAGWWPVDGDRRLAVGKAWVDLGCCFFSCSHVLFAFAHGTRYSEQNLRGHLQKGGPWLASVVTLVVVVSLVGIWSANALRAKNQFELDWLCQAFMLN